MSSPLTINPYPYRTPLVPGSPVYRPRWSSPPRGDLLILGPAKSGKTTELRRLEAECRGGGAPALWLSIPEGEGLALDLARGLRALLPAVRPEAPWEQLGELPPGAALFIDECQWLGESPNLPPLPEAEQQARRGLLQSLLQLLKDGEAQARPRVLLCGQGPAGLLDPSLASARLERMEMWPLQPGDLVALAQLGFAEQGQAWVEALAKALWSPARGQPSQSLELLNRCWELRKHGELPPPARLVEVAVSAMTRDPDSLVLRLTSERWSRISENIGGTAPDALLLLLKLRQSKEQGLAVTWPLKDKGAEGLLRSLELGVVEQEDGGWRLHNPGEVMRARFDERWARRELLRFERPWSLELQRWSEGKGFPLDLNSFIDQLGDARYQPLSDSEKQWHAALRAQRDRRIAEEEEKARKAREEAVASLRRIEEAEKRAEAARLAAEEAEKRARRAEWVTYILFPIIAVLVILGIIVAQNEVEKFGRQVGALNEEVKDLKEQSRDAFNVAIMAEESANSALQAAQAPLKALNLQERLDAVEQLQKRIRQVDAELGGFLDKDLKECGQVEGAEPGEGASADQYAAWALAANSVVLCQERALVVAVSQLSIRASEGVKQTKRDLEQQRQAIETQRLQVQDQARRVAELQGRTEAALAEAQRSRDLTRAELEEVRRQSEATAEQSRRTAQALDAALSSGVKSALQAAIETCFKESDNDAQEIDCLRRAFGVRP